MRWTRFRGLRARLILAFIAVTVIGAAAASWASAATTGRALLAGTQQRIADEIRRQVTAMAPSLEYPPDSAGLGRIANAVGGQVEVTYRTLRVARGADLNLVTPELRSAVRGTGGLRQQRVTSGTGMKLLVGTALVTTELDGTRTPSGIEIYAVRDLGNVQQQIGAMTENAASTSALALPVAVLLALLAARGVLRPVRELRGTARRLAGGDLDARLRPRGADELAELASTFNETAASLQRSVGELARMEADARRFVADVSHELRTPLTTLTATAEMLEADAARLPPDTRESVLLAVAETRRLARLVADLMEVSRFDAGAVRLHPEHVDVPAVVRECLRARAWGERVEWDAPDELAAVLDRRRLDVIVSNLVGNALRHGAPPVLVRLRGDGDWVYLDVLDHGPGLPDGAAEHVFDRFYKADAARSDAEGSGLGMAITAENVRLHGGEITVRDSPAGAHFAVRLPRWAGEAP